MSEKKKTLTGELVEIFKSLPSELKPDATNDFQHYSYNSIQQIKKVVGTELKKHGILFLPLLVKVETLILKEESEENKVSNKVLTTAEFNFEFLKGDEKLEVHSFGQAVDSQGKGLSKAKSDAIKRLFTDMFLIATGDEDDEKDYGSPTPAPQQRTQKTTYGSMQMKNPDSPLTTAQNNMIWRTAKKKDIPKEAIEEKVKVKFQKTSVSELTKAEASELISELLGD